MLDQYKTLLVKHSIATKQYGKNHPEVAALWQQLKAIELQLTPEQIINCTHEAFNPLSTKPYTLNPITHCP